jgi:hypothetical protein
MSLLVKFLEQNDDYLSETAKGKKIAILKEDEIRFMDGDYREIFT